MNKELFDSTAKIYDGDNFPLKMTEDTLSELGTLIECGEMTGQDIPDDMLEVIANL